MPAPRAIAAGLTKTEARARALLPSWVVALLTRADELVVEVHSAREGREKRLREGSQRALRERRAGFGFDLIAYFRLISSRGMPVPGL